MFMVTAQRLWIRNGVQERRIVPTCRFANATRKEAARVLIGLTYPDGEYMCTGDNIKRPHL
jgi:hypothetical protein